MTIKDKSGFVYNGVESDDLGIANVNIETGMSEEIFLADTTINEVTIKGRVKPYFNSKTYTPLMFNLSFAFLNQWDDEMIREVARVFHVDYYKPLYFEDEDDVIYYCMPVDSSQIIHNSLKQGYVNMTFRCNDICAYSTIKNKTYTDFASELKFTNGGDLLIYPVFEFETNNTNVSIKNNTNNQELELEGLTVGERIRIDNENEIIANRDNSTLYRYINHNNVFIKMEVGTNRLTVSGLSSLKIIWRFKILAS